MGLGKLEGFPKFHVWSLNMLKLAGTLPWTLNNRPE
jgi:hypothetical protein